MIHLRCAAGTVALVCSGATAASAGRCGPRSRICRTGNYLGRARTQVLVSGGTACRAAVTMAVRSPDGDAPQGSATNGDLWQRIQSVYHQALESGALYKTDSSDQFIEDGGVEFVVRVAASLRDKPKPPNSGEKKEWRNPFLPYEEALWVTHLSDRHTLLLNKFNVVPYHSLVVTRDFQQQTEPLNAADLGAAWQVLQAMPEGGICYFNCGPDSGASQPHKHLQIVPLPLATGRDAATPFCRLLDEACSAASGLMDSAATLPRAVEVRLLPFRSYATRVPPPERVTPEVLAQMAGALFEAMKAGATTAEPGSYNVVLTLQHLHLIPRLREFSGPVACNALGFAGTLFVRSVEELEYTRSRGPLQILADVGLPW